jgi:amphi-Trp domain-containing protein
MELMEIKQEGPIGREAAAAWLRDLADSLARHNDVEFVREGLRYTIAVPSVINMEVELEVEDDETKLEIELSW